MGRCALNFFSFQEYLSIRGFVHAADGIEESGLTGAVGTDDAKSLSFVDGEVKTVDCFKASEVHLKAFYSH